MSKTRPADADKTSETRTDAILLPSAPAPQGAASAAPAPTSIPGLIGGAIYGLLSSVKFGVFLLALIAVWVGLGTFNPVLDYFDFTMPDWYRYKPFQAVEYLLCLNLTVVTFRQIPFNLPNLGVWIIHGSILLIAIGSTWFGYGWTDAVTRIDRGYTQFYAYDQNTYGEALSVWRAPPAGTVAPDLWTGYSPIDLSEQLPIPQLPPSSFHGGVEVNDRLIRLLTPEAETLVALKGFLKARGAPEDADDRLEGAKPLGAGTHEMAQARLADAFSAEEIKKFALDKAVTDARIQLAAFQNRLRKGGSRFAIDGEELEKRVADAMAPLPLTSVQRELIKEISAHGYSQGPFVTKDGLKLTITHSWPRVKIDTDIDADTVTPESGRSVTTVWADIQGSRRTAFVTDPYARRADIRRHTETVESFTEAMRQAFEAQKRREAVVRAGGDPASAMAAAEARAEAVRELLGRLKNRPPEARLVVGRPGEVTAADFAATERFYRFNVKGRDAAEVRAMPIKPPAPVAYVFITDPRLDKPLVVFMDDWEKAGTISLEAAGLPNDRLVLLPPDKGVEYMLKVSLSRSLPGALPPLVFRYRIESEGKPPVERMCLGSMNIDPSLAKREDPTAAIVPVTERLMAHAVQTRTAAVQVVNVRDGDTVKPRRLVWSLAAGEIPYLAYREASVEEGPNPPPYTRRFDFMRFFWDRDEGRELDLLVGKSVEGDVSPAVEPVLIPEPGKSPEDYYRAVRITAEYDYKDAEGKPKTWRRSVWAFKTSFPDIQRFEAPEMFARLEVPTLGPVELGWSGRRVPLGPDGNVRARLEHFQLELMPGSAEKHKEYSSYVTFSDLGDAAGERTQTVKICMNEPKKADRWWFSQNSYDPRRFAWTVLSVANKPGWSDPPLVPYAMGTLVCGVLWAFLIKPQILRSRRNANRAAAGGG